MRRFILSVALLSKSVSLNDILAAESKQKQQVESRRQPLLPGLRFVLLNCLYQYNVTTINVKINKQEIESLNQVQILCSVGVRNSNKERNVAYGLRHDIFKLDFLPFQIRRNDFLSTKY